MESNREAVSKIKVKQIVGHLFILGGLFYNQVFYSLCDWLKIFNQSVKSKAKAKSKASVVYSLITIYPAIEAGKTPGAGLVYFAT